MSEPLSASALLAVESFVDRHLGPDADEQQRMLESLGVTDRAALIAEAVPATIRMEGELALPAALDEQSALARLREYASLNELRTSLIGMGYYGTVVPPVIQRNVLENPGWYTASRRTSRKSPRVAWKPC